MTLSHVEIVRRLARISECCAAVKPDADPLWVARGVAQMVADLQKAILHERDAPWTDN